MNHVRSGQDSCFFASECPVVSILFVEKTLSLELPLLLPQRSVDCISVGLFLDSPFSSIDSSVLSPIPHCLDAVVL